MYSGIDIARKYHLLFIHISRYTGIFGFTLGIVSNSPFDIFLISIVLGASLVYYYSDKKDENLQKVMKLMLDDIMD
eukprot:gene6198-10204_t